MTKKRSDQPNAEFCQFPFSDGRRCLMLRHPPAPAAVSFPRPRRAPASRIAPPGRRNRHHPHRPLHLQRRRRPHPRQSLRRPGPGPHPSEKSRTLGYLGQIMLQAMPQVARETDLGFSSTTWIELVNESVYPQASRARSPIHIQTHDEAAAANPAAAPAPDPSVPASQAASAPSYREGSSRTAAPPPTTGTPPPTTQNKSQSAVNDSVVAARLYPEGSARRAAVPAPPTGVTIPPSSRANSPLTPSESAHPKNPPVSAVESALPKNREGATTHDQNSPNKIPNAATS